jgi:ubiquinone/menaquinone biosynthesis C-methylase UbiE
MKERFIEHVLTDETRIQGYQDKIGTGAAFLEVGCGTAALVRAAEKQKRFDFAVGSDVAFRWLLIARRGLEEAGLPANLVCCCADHLPFPDGYFDSVASVSLLEHMPDAGAGIREFARTTKPGGRIFLWTTNRFSLAPEPHVRVWGVGFLPRRWMPAYVKWAKGLIYEKKYLRSCFEIRRLFRASGVTRMAFSLPAITSADWQHLGAIEKWGARVFIWLAKVPVLRLGLVVVSPVIQVVARRQNNNQTTGTGS